MKHNILFDPTYRLKDLQQYSGLSAVQLRYLDDRGIVRPSIQPGGSRGAIRIYSLEDLMDALAIGRWKQLKFSTQRILQACFLWKGAGIRPWEGITYIGLHVFSGPDMAALPFHERAIDGSAERKISRKAILEPELGIEAKAAFESRREDVNLEENKMKRSLLSQFLTLVWASRSKSARGEAPWEEKTDWGAWEMRTFFHDSLTSMAEQHGKAFRELLEALRIAVQKEDKNHVFELAKKVLKSLNSVGGQPREADGQN